MKRVKLFEEYALGEKKITLDWDDDETSIVFSDGEVAQVDYDGDFKYRGEWFSTADHTSGEDLIKDLQKKFKKDRFEWAFESSELKENKSPKLKPTDKTIRQHINQYSVNDDPYDVASEIGKKYGWNESDIEKAERIIRKKYIR